MKEFQSADDLTATFKSDIEKLASRVLDVLTEELSKSADDIYKEFGARQQAIINKIFVDAVDEFYASYTPGMYKRTMGLYKLLDLPLDENGMVSGVLSGVTEGYLHMFDESKMHSDRSGGNSLFQTVFIEGWHGGAKSIGPDSVMIDPHPDASRDGTAYYRTRGYALYRDSGRRKWHRYGRWGSVAVRTESAYDIFSSELADAAQHAIWDAFRSISTKHIESAVSRVYRQIPSIKKDIYG